MLLFQVRYAAQEIPAAKSARARGSYLRVSFKNTRETAQAVKGMKLERALKFLDNVHNKAEVVPMRRYAGSEGRTAQGECIRYLLSCVAGVGLGWTFDCYGNFDWDWWWSTMR